MTIPPGYAGFTVRLSHASVSRPAYITGGVEIVTPPVTSVAVVLETIFAGAGSDFAELMDFDVTIGPVTAYIGQDGGESIVQSGTLTRNGGVATTSLPGNCAVLVHKRTARGGRRGRGRWFIPWTIGESNVDEAGKITPANVTQLQTEMTALLGDFDSIGLPLVVLHEPSAPDAENPTTAGLPNRVTQLVVDPLIATQRRRLGR
jgi:hypothetical protein